MTEDILAMVGAVALIAAAAVFVYFMRQTFLRASRVTVPLERVHLLENSLRRLDDGVDDLKERREFNAAGEIDALSNKLNSIRGSGRALEIVRRDVNKVAGDLGNTKRDLGQVATRVNRVEIDHPKLCVRVLDLEERTPPKAL